MRDLAVDAFLVIAAKTVVLPFAKERMRRQQWKCETIMNHTLIDGIRSSAVLRFEWY